MELGANYYRTRAHYSRELVQLKYREGKEGPALCSTESFPVQVYDKVAHEAHERKYGLKPRDLASLPVCKKCVRAAAKAAPGEAA